MNREQAMQKHAGVWISVRVFHFQHEAEACARTIGGRAMKHECGWTVDVYRENA